VVSPLRPGRARVLATLGALYFAQGLPFGFQSKTLQYLLTEKGVSLTVITFAGALSLPWALKPLWAPLVDRFGARRQWIVPLQAALALTLTLAGQYGDGELITLLGLVLLMNLLTATQDIAVDGLAVDLLDGAELGSGNAMQVVGYKLGMLMSGSVLVLVCPTQAAVFYVMAALVAAAGLALVGLQETRRAPGGDGLTLTGIVRVLLQSAAVPGGLALLGWVLTYKLGESVSDSLWKPFLQRGLGHSKDTLATWDALFGMPLSIAGSLLGGLVAMRIGPLRAVSWLALSRLVPAALQLWVAWSLPTSSAPVIAVTCAEELTGGALTTAMFAFMMSRVDRRIGATHFTALAALEVVGKTPGSLLSGALADSTGSFPVVFGVALSLSVVALVWLVPLRRQAVG
jgi:PAT family beta-lactamase induction signal transducer AmpG